MENLLEPASSTDLEDVQVDIANHLHQLTQGYTTSDVARHEHNLIRQTLDAGDAQPGFNASVNEQQLKPAASFWTQCRILSRRSMINLYRNPMLLVMHYSISIVLGLLLGTLFWDVSDDLSGVQNRLGSLFFMCALLGFGSLSSLEVINFILN